MLSVLNAVRPLSHGWDHPFGGLVEGFDDSLFMTDLDDLTSDYMALPQVFMPNEELIESDSESEEEEEEEDEDELEEEEEEEEEQDDVEVDEVETTDDEDQENLAQKSRSQHRYVAKKAPKSNKTTQSTPSNQSRQQQKRSCLSFSTVSFTQSRVVTQDGSEFVSKRRRYEDSTGKLDAVDEKRMNGHLLKSIWKRKRGDDKCVHKKLCSSGDANAFEKLWSETTLDVLDEMPLFKKRKLSVIDSQDDDDTATTNCAKNKHNKTKQKKKTISNKVKWAATNKRSKLLSSKS